MEKYVTDQVLSVLDAASAIKILIILQTRPHSKREILTETLKKTSYFYNHVKLIAPLLEYVLIEPEIISLTDSIRNTE